MIIRTRVAAALAALTLVVSACGADDPETATTTEMEAADGDADTDATQTSDETGMTGSATSDDRSETSDDMEGQEHEHDEPMLIDWPADRELPTIEITTEALGNGDVAVSFDIEGFAVRGGDEADIPDGAGHLHVTLDGRDLGMLFEPETTLTDLEPGRHEIVVGLASGAHGIYAVDGVPLRYSATFEVAGETGAADAVVEIEVDEDGVVGGVVEAVAPLGGTVEIVVESAVDEELHVHAYDVYGELAAGETTTVRFEADIPGVFEVELERSGRQVISLQVS